MTKKELMVANGELQRALDAAEYEAEKKETTNNILRMQIAELKQELALAANDKAVLLLEMEKRVLTEEEWNYIFKGIEKEITEDVRPYTFFKNQTFRFFQRYSAATQKESREYWAIKLKELAYYWKLYFQEGEETAANYISNQVEEVLKKYGLHKKERANLLRE